MMLGNTMYRKKRITKTKTVLIAGLIGLLLFRFTTTSQAQDLPAALQDRLQQLQVQVNEAETSSQFVLEGERGWLFFVPEVRSILVGPFWGEDSAIASRSTRPEFADPLPAILDFHQQLSDAGIELVVVPVPAKSAAVSENLLGAEVPIPKDWRIDANHVEFLKVLTEAGVEVIDLYPHFREFAQTEGRPAYCLTDTHWSGLGGQAAANAIADYVRTRDWYKPVTDSELTIQSQVVDILGDLTVMRPSNLKEKESVPIALVRDSEGQPIPISKESEILLLGDSHTIVFHDPGLYAQGAGLPDHLAYQLGRPVDLIGVRGSGSTSARITLARQKGRLVGKKLVVWCFAAREFTESTDGWRKLPLPSFDP